MKSRRTRVVSNEGAELHEGLQDGLTPTPTVPMRPRANTMGRPSHVGRPNMAMVVDTPAYPFASWR
jgi:hypothetical protein